jgi:hypothetical protein
VKIEAHIGLCGLKAPSGISELGGCPSLRVVNDRVGDMVEESEKKTGLWRRDTRYFSLSVADPFLGWSPSLQP